ncbi:OprD family porin [Pseudomonas silvicola]|nr:OprD family porin [Pseudomonas silvicola]
MNTKFLCTVGLLGFGISAASQALAVGAQADSKGFIEDASLDLLLRNYMMNRNYVHGYSNNFGNTKGGYRREWAQSGVLTYQSGFTQGTVGFGLDVYARAGIKLDGGGGHTGTQLLPIGDDRKSDASYGSAGTNLKIRVSRTQLSYGDSSPINPVFWADTSGRLQPQMAHGWRLLSSDIPDVELDAGRFTSGKPGSGTSSERTLKSAYGGRPMEMYEYAGGRYKLSKQTDLSFYASQGEDFWNQYYFGASHTFIIDPLQSFKTQFNAYRYLDTGRALAGKVNGFISSLTGAYTYGPHTFTAAIQKNHSDTPYDYVGFDDGKSTLSNALNTPMQLEEFQGPNEKVWQLRYDVDMAAFGVPGLSFKAQYQQGHGDGSHADPTGDYAKKWGADSRHWERDLEARYVVQSGPAKNLNIRVRQATARGNSDHFSKDADELRLILELPIKIF